MKTIQDKEAHLSEQSQEEQGNLVEGYDEHDFSDCGNAEPPVCFDSFLIL